MITDLIKMTLAVFTLICAMWTSTPVTDTVSVPINGKDGTADFKIDDGTNSRAYACFLDMFRVREITEMTVTDTFCVEGTADQEPGRSQLVGEISGILKKGGALSGPLIPAPQGVTILMTYSAGCTISCKANFTEASADRLVNQTARFSGRFLSKGAYVVTWARS